VIRITYEDRLNAHSVGRRGHGGVLKKVFPSQSLLLSDLGSFRRQETILISLDLSILLVLFALHLYFASYWGRPAPLLIAGVALGVVFKAGGWLWLRRLSKTLEPALLVGLTWSSIALNIALASMLAVLTDREDTPCFVLMVVAVLEAAFRFELPAILGVVAIVDASLFWQVWLFFSKHPPLDVGEYYEAGITSLLFYIVGVLVWLLLTDLRRKETRLANNLLELERAREQLVARRAAGRSRTLFECYRARDSKSGGDDLKLYSHGEAAFGGGARRDV
jgi:hypothetical protein